MGFSSDDEARRIILTLLVTAVALAAVFLVFARLYGWLAALVATGGIVFILLIAIATSTTHPRFLIVFIPLIAVYLLVAFFVFAHLFGWSAALKGIGAAVLIMLIAGWVIYRIGLR